MNSSVELIERSHSKNESSINNKSYRRDMTEYWKKIEDLQSRLEATHPLYRYNKTPINNISQFALNAEITKRLEELASPTLPNYRVSYEALNFNRSFLGSFSENSTYISKMHCRYLSEYERQIKTIDKLLMINPNDYNSLRKKGVALTYLGRCVIAIECFDKVLKIKPDDYCSLDCKGFALITLKKYLEAAVCFEEAMKIEPDFPLALYHLSVVLKVTGKPDEAKIKFDKAISSKPDIYVELVNYANALFCRKKFDEAIEWYDMVLEIKFDHHEAVKNKSIAKQELDHKTNSALSADASTRLVELATPKKNFAKLNKNVLFLFSPSNSTETSASSSYQISSRLDELALPRKVYAKYQSKNSSSQSRNTSAKTLNRTFSARLERLSEPRKNLGALNKDVLTYLNINNNQPPQQTDKKYILILEKYETQIETYDKLLKTSPDNHEALNSKAVALSYLGRYNEAFESIDKALKIKPTDFHSIDFKGFIYIILEKYKEAADCFEEALKIKPDFPLALYHKSYILKMNGKSEVARVAFEKAIESKHDLDNELLIFANSLFARKEYENCIKWYDQVLKVKPDNQEALENKKTAKKEQDKIITKITNDIWHVTPSSLNDSKTAFDIFISYSWKQKKQVKNLFNILTSHGLSCWMDDNQLKPGDKLFKQLADAIHKSKLVLFCISKDYLSSDNCQREFDYTFKLKKSHIPIILCKDKKQEFGEWPCHHSVFFVLADVIYVANLFEHLDKPEEDCLNIENTPLVDFIQKIKTILQSKNNA